MQTPQSITPEITHREFDKVVRDIITKLYAETAKRFGEARSPAWTTVNRIRNDLLSLNVQSFNKGK